MEAGEERLVTVGRISGLYGVRGWVRVYSHTDPRENILTYSPWYLNLQGKWTPFELVGGRPHGKGVVAQLSGCVDRDAAAGLLGADVAILREQFPPTEEDEFYWADLIGLRVETGDGLTLGRVEDLMETGANDVLIVKGERERLIPFVIGDVVQEVDREAGVIRVDWDPEF